MSDSTTSRRDFMKLAATTAGGVWLAAHWPAVLAAAKAADEVRAAGSAFAVLDVQDARDLEAITAQIIPSGDTPGAREAGVVYFIDQALRSFQAGARPALQEGLKDLNARARRLSPGAARFSDLGDAQQVELLSQIDEGPFFQTVRTMTLFGMFALPSYGGNRDHQGWSLIGFDHQHVWQPPFGYYDAAYRKTGDDGER